MAQVVGIPEVPEPEESLGPSRPPSRSFTPIPSQHGTAKFKRPASRHKDYESRESDSPDSGAINGDHVLITQGDFDDEDLADGRMYHPAYSDDEDFKNLAGSAWNRPNLIDFEKDNGYDTDLEIEEEDDTQESDTFDPTGSHDYIKECNRLGVIPAQYFLRHLNDREFIMRNHGLGPNGAKAIAKPFEVNTQIEKIDLEGNHIEATGVKHLSKMLRENLYITDLVLSENHIGGEGAATVCQMLMENRIIRSLDLSGNNLKDHHGEMFYQILEKNSVLQKLYLRHNHFESVAAAWFRDGLAINESLRVLDLSWNHLRLRGARSISEGVQENYGLKELYVSMNGFGYDGAKHMGHALKHNQSLEVLDLSSNRIPSEGVLEIAKGLKVNENLTMLKLGMNPISPIGTTPIIMALQRNEGTNVKFISLQGIMIMEEFDEIQEKMAEGGVHIQVVHAGIISDKEIKLPLPTKIDPEALFWSDPMTKLKRFAADTGFRLIDVFKQFDKDNSWTVDREEFIMGVKSKSIPLTEEEIDILIDRLDQDGDGEIDYKELCDGDEENRAMAYQMHRWKREKEEEEKNKPPTPEEVDPLADSDDD